MRFILYVIILCFYICCDRNIELNQANEKTGIGIIYLDPNYPIHLFKNEFDTIVFDSIIFIKNKAFDKGSYSIENKSISKILMPYDYYLGDNDKKSIENINKGLLKFQPMIAFKVLEHKNNLYKILLNDFTKEYCFINTKGKINLNYTDYLNKQNFNPNSVPESIENWFYYESWLKHLKHSIILNEDLKFYETTNKEIELKINDDNFVIDTLINEWVKCYFGENKFGWTKWKENDSILFEFNRFIYY